MKPLQHSVGLLARVLLTGGLLAGLAGAQQTQISYESFDYGAGPLGGQSGGFGWTQPWWAGNGLDDGIVDPIGYDAVGGKVVVTHDNAGIYRQPDLISVSQILTPGGNFGADGSTLWISWTAQRGPNSTDLLGYLILNRLLVQAEVQIGEIYNTGLIGIKQPGQAAHLIPGSDPSLPHRFVLRLDYQAGPEHAFLWLDPPVPHPIPALQPPDLDVMLVDHTWNEFGFAAGVNGGGTTEYFLDELVLEYEGGSFPPIGSSYCTAQPNSTGQAASIQALGVDFAGGQPLQLRASDLPPNQFGYFLASLNQGFTPFPGGSQGILCLSLPIARFSGQIVSSGGSGEFQIDVDTLAVPMTPPVAIQSGDTWYFQAWYRDQNPTNTSNFTDGVLVTFQ